MPSWGRNADAASPTPSARRTARAPGRYTGPTGPGGRSGRAALGVRTLPAAPVHVAAFLTDRAEEGCRPATLRAALAAIAFAHKAEGLDSPTKDEGVGATMRGLSRMLGGRSVRRRDSPGTASPRSGRWRACRGADGAVVARRRSTRGGGGEWTSHWRR